MKISIVKVLKKTFQCDGTCFVDKKKLEKSYRTLLLKEQTLHASFHRRPTHESGKINVPIIRYLGSHEYLLAQLF